MIPDPAPPFEVDASGTVKDYIRRMLQRAAVLDVRDEIVRSLRTILEGLTNDPRNWGDPLWRFHAAQMTRYGRMAHGFRCEYSVHDRIPTVVLTDLYPVPGNPLHENFEG
jgi:hypothetical protein